MANIMKPSSDIELLDDMPIPICKLSCEKQSAVCRKEPGRAKDTIRQCQASFS